MKRAYQRCILGTKFKGEYRLLTLSTPEDFEGDIHNAWRRFVRNMRRRGLLREYFVVKEWNKKHTCVHLHAILRLSWIDYMLARMLWNRITGAVWIHVDKVKGYKHMTRYLTKYLVKSFLEEPQKRAYWYAYEWIYRKYRAFVSDMFKLGVRIRDSEHFAIKSLNLHMRKVYFNERIFYALIDYIRKLDFPPHHIRLTCVS